MLNFQEISVSVLSQHIGLFPLCHVVGVVRKFEASPASMSRRTRPARPSVAHLTNMPPSHLELDRQAKRTPSPPSPGSTGSRRGTLALRVPPSSNGDREQAEYHRPDRSIDQEDRKLIRWTSSS